MPPQLPTAADLAILAGAIWESRPVRVARAVAIMIPAITIIVALAVATKVEDVWPEG